MVVGPGRVGPEKMGEYESTASFGFLWYCYAIVSKDVDGQYGAVWARFVLVTSLLLCFRFSTLLARHCRRVSSE